MDIGYASHLQIAASYCDVLALVHEEQGRFPQMLRTYSCCKCLQDV